MDSQTRKYEVWVILVSIDFINLNYITMIVMWPIWKNTNSNGNNSEFVMLVS